MNAGQTIAAFAIRPGWSQTAMGNTGARACGMDEDPIAVKDSCSQMVQFIDGSTNESHDGKLWGHDGEQQAW